MLIADDQARKKTTDQALVAWRSLSTISDPGDMQPGDVYTVPGTLYEGKVQYLGISFQVENHLGVYITLRMLLEADMR